MSRKLTAPEKSLWQIITRRITPLHPEAAMAEVINAAEERVALREKAIKGKPSVMARPKPASVLPASAEQGREVDRKTLQRLQRGQIEIEATLDLHGYSVKDAEHQLRAFVRLAHQRQMRCLLIIHGKGSLNGEAKIKRAMPDWLNEMPDVVLAHAGAKPQHGGQGASYLLLRRKRVTL